MHIDRILQEVTRLTQRADENAMAITGVAIDDEHLTGGAGEIADVQAEFSISDLFDLPAETDLRIDDIDIADTGTVHADMSITVESEEALTRGAANDDQATDDLVREEEAASPHEDATGDDDEAATAEATPPHRDPDQLRDVYDPDKTFPEMTEELGADVTPQTVRRQMIEYGIHESGEFQSDTSDDETEEPDTSETATADGPDGEPTANGTEPDAKTIESDGGTRSEVSAGGREPGEDLAGIDAEFPEGVSVEAFRTAVAGAQTVYDVQRDLDLDRETTRDLLDRFDLLERVSGRLAADDPGPTLEEIDERLRSATPN